MENKEAEGSKNTGGPGHGIESADKGTVVKLLRGHLYNIMAKTNLISFCLWPKNVCEIECNFNEIICLAEDISRLDSI